MPSRSRSVSEFQQMRPSQTHQVVVCLPVLRAACPDATYHGVSILAARTGPRLFTAPIMAFLKDCRKAAIVGSSFCTGSAEGLQLRSMAERPLSPGMHACGLCLLAGSLPWTIRLVWEMTLLTWHEGPQMVGFSIAHTMPALLIFGSLFSISAAVWGLSVGVLALTARRSLSAHSRALLAAVLISVSLPLVPYSAWQWMTVQVLGVPKLDSPAGRAMYDVLVAAGRDGNIDTIQALLHRA